MKCPFCGAIDTRVVDSRPAADGSVLRRRRNCELCAGRFTTHERLVELPLLLVKKDGRREEFQPEKLRTGLLKACNKRPISAEAINTLIQDVEATLRGENKSEPNKGELNKGEIAASVVGDLVMDRLFVLDEVAYVRFASVYQRFDDVRRFAQLLERMSRRQRQREQKS